MAPRTRPNIDRLHAYTPGEQPTADQTAAGLVKLNTNENPYPPSPAALRAIRGVTADQLRLYPPVASPAFCEAAARVHGVDPDQILTTNGGDELLRMAMTVFCEPGSAGAGGGLGLTRPTYSLYEVLAGIHGTPITHVDRVGEDFELPDDLANRWNDAGCGLAMLVNPHAPTGRLEPIATVRALARAFRGLLLVDEAYVDFADADVLPLVNEVDNVLVLRSLSKGYALAGLRFGYGIGPRRIIDALHKARDSYNLDAVAQAAGAAAIADQATARASWDAVASQRRRLTEALGRRGWRVWPSATNFVLVQPPADGLDAAGHYQRLKQRGVLVRHFEQPRLEDKLRITVGTAEQVDRLLAELDAIANG